MRQHSRFFFFSEIVLISFILSRTHFLFAFLLRTWLKLRLSDYDYDLTPSSSNSRQSAGSSLIPVVASAIRSRMQRASSKSSRAAAVRLRSRQRPILTPAAANAAPADFRRRAYSKRSSVEFRIFTAYLLRVVDHHYHHLSLCRLTARCWVHG